MQFQPAPANDFAEFIATYYERCRERVPQIEANAGKWTFRDLIPALSDFDTRFLVSDTMDTAGWCRMSTAVGQVHLELATERKEWVRNLEHLPGVNLRWSELLDPALYFTEFAQWTFYRGDTQQIARAHQALAQHQWNAIDEMYHWKKIAIYYGAYNRTIDPAINLGPYENKYPLHSRLMHYFAPAVHAAWCLLQRSTTPGKLEAFQRAREAFPNPSTMDLALELIDKHYEAPHYLCEPGITELDRMLESYLRHVVDTLFDAGCALNCPRSPTVQQLRTAVAAMPQKSSGSQLFENVKFSRLMKGRLWFYAQDLPWFQSELLIRNELSRIRQNFLQSPVRLYVKLTHGIEVDADRALQMLQGEIFDNEQVEACRRFAVLADPDCPDELLKQRALQIAGVFDAFFYAIEHLVECARSVAQ